MDIDGVLLEARLRKARFKYSKGSAKQIDEENPRFDKFCRCSSDMVWNEKEEAEEPASAAVYRQQSYLLQ